VKYAIEQEQAGSTNAFVASCKCRRHYSQLRLFLQVGESPAVDRWASPDFLNVWTTLWLNFAGLRKTLQ